MKPPFVRNPYNYDVDKASTDSGLDCKDPSLTQQQFAEESDINYIANRYGLTGEAPQVTQLPRQGDFTGVFDFQTALNSVVQAQRQFMTLPAKMRNRFANNPQQLLEFLENPDNRDEAIFLGLIERPKEPLQSPKGDAEDLPGGETLPPKGKAPAKPPKQSPKGDNTDT